MGGYELGDHTADLKLVAWGDDLADALTWLATGMFSFVADLDTIEPQQTLHVSVSSTDREALAVDWLNELLFRYEAEGFLPKWFDVSVSERETDLNARCTGERADPERHRTRSAVKAATYHGLQVSHNGQWRIQVVLDI